MPNRSRSGLVSMPARVVAPTSVNGCRSSLIERLAARLGRADENLQLLARLGLADVFREELRPQGALDRFLVRRRGRSRDHALVRRGREVVGLDRHFARAFSACLMPSLTPM